MPRDSELIEKTRSSEGMSVQAAEFILNSHTKGGLDYHIHQLDQILLGGNPSHTASEYCARQLEPYTQAVTEALEVISSEAKMTALIPIT